MSTLRLPRPDRGASANVDDALIWLGAAAASTFVAALALTWLVRALAYRFGLVAPTRDDRWHKRPTALLGGIGIFVAFMVGCLLFLPDVPRVGAVLLGGTLLFGAGLWDDLRPMRPYVKLIIQVCAAALIVYLGLSLPWTDQDVLNNAITIFWLVGITNALNLLDNMDGLAGGIAIIASVAMAITFIVSGQINEAVIPVMLAGAVLGFLIFNRHPATIFMGDAGSMFLGVTLGSAALLSDYGRSRSLAAVLFTPVLILLIPIVDTALVAISRKSTGRSISQGGLDHASHRLVAMGLTEGRAVVTLYLLAAVSGVMALAVGALDQGLIWLIVPTFILGIVGFAFFLGQVVVHDEVQASVVDSRMMRVLSDLRGKRRIFEVLLDIALITLAYYGAYVLRYDGGIPQGQAELLGRTLPIVLIVEVVLLTLGGVYRTVWRYVGIGELVILGRSVAAGGLASAVVVILANPDIVVSRSVFVLQALLLVLLIGGSRLSYRVLRVMFERQRGPTADSTPVLIYGAGDGGELVVREILNNPGHRYSPIGFVDDDGRKTGKAIHGFRIFDSQEIPELMRRHGVTEILISTGQVSEGKLEALRSLGIRPRRVSIEFE